MIRIYFCPRPKRDAATYWTVSWKKKKSLHYSTLGYILPISYCYLLLLFGISLQYYIWILFWMIKGLFASLQTLFEIIFSSLFSWRRNSLCLSVKNIFARGWPLYCIFPHFLTIVRNFTAIILMGYLEEWKGGRLWHTAYHIPSFSYSLKLIGTCFLWSYMVFCRPVLIQPSDMEETKPLLGYWPGFTSQFLSSDFIAVFHVT